MARAKPMSGQQPAARELRAAVLSVFARYADHASHTVTRLKSIPPERRESWVNASVDHWTKVEQSLAWVAAQLRLGVTVHVWTADQLAAVVDVEPPENGFAGLTEREVAATAAVKPKGKNDATG